MSLDDVVGYLAALLVLVAFSMRDMVVLRLVAIASNLAFLAYGALADLPPVLLLHAVLLPTNLFRLTQLMRERLGAKKVGLDLNGHRQNRPET
ncbi:MAG: hypothetical protein SFU83_16165 [Meiothermus sp.]|nr:hypothetical protein [Meiothermus sp.]